MGDNYRHCHRFDDTHANHGSAEPTETESFFAVQPIAIMVVIVFVLIACVVALVDRSNKPLDLSEV